MITNKQLLNTTITTSHQKKSFALLM